MKLFFKIFLALIILVIITVVGFAVVFDPNDYKEDIIALTKEKTGRELFIPGDISLSLFPWIGIDLGAIEISNAKGFGKQPFAKMSHLQVRAKLWPLLKQQLEADTIVVEGLNLNLAKNQQGISNWDDLTKQSAEIKSTDKTPPKADSEKITATNVLGALALNGIIINNAQFNWHDQQLKQKISVKDVQLSMGKLRPEIKIPLKLQFHLLEQSLDTQIKLDSEIKFSPDLKQFSFYDTQLQSKLKLTKLKKHLSPQLNSALMQLNIEKQTFDTTELTLSEGSLKLQTQLSGTKLFSEPTINSQIIIPSLNPRALAENFSINLPVMADKKALTKFNAQLNIKGTLKNLGFTNIELSLDDTHLVGNANIRPTPDSSRINLVVDTINLDRYLPTPVESKTTSTPVKNQKPQEAALIPIALLGAFNLDADFKVEKLQIKKTHWKNIHLVSRAKNGILKIKPLTAEGYNAKVQSAFNIKTIKNDAQLSGQLDIKNINAGELLNDLIGKDKLKGQTSIAANFTTSGLKLTQLKQNLNGKLKLNLKEGTLKGFDLKHQQRILEAKIKRKPIPTAPIPEETKIANLSATAAIKNGLLKNNDLRASTPLSRIIGRGTVDIAKEQLNYKASVKFTSSTDIKANKPYEKMNAVPLDIYIKGTFEKPDINVDFKKALSQLLKKEIKKQERKLKEKVTDDVKKDLKKKLENKLKKLLKF